MIPYLGELATGLDAGLIAGQVACGRPPSLDAAEAALRVVEA